MFILKKIREFCFNLSILFGLGEWSFSSLLASLLAIPLIFFTRFLYSFISNYYLNSTLVLLFFVYLVILFLALGFITEKYKSDIVINKLVGMLFVFWGVDLTLKSIIIGFIIFHVFSFFGPFIFYKISNRKLDALPMHIGILVSDVVYGLLSNFLLLIIMWFIR